MKLIMLVGAAILCLVGNVNAATRPASMHPPAKLVPRYSLDQKRDAARRIFRSPSLTLADHGIDVTVNAPLDKNRNARLGFWGADQVTAGDNDGWAVLGTTGTQQITEPGVSIGFIPAPGKSYLADCRIYSSASVAYTVTIYTNPDTPSQSDTKTSGTVTPTADGHVLFGVAGQNGLPSYVGVWIAPNGHQMAFVGCEFSPVG